MTGERSEAVEPNASLRPVVVIGGPTASGKSDAAVAVAEAFGGTVINADSMQVYQELRIVTARPDDAMMAAVPHRLFGLLSARERCSAGRWRDLAVAEIDAAHAAGRLPVVVGGTGLYLKALTEGLAPMPEIPDAVSRDAADLMARCGPEGFHRRLAAIDPAVAAAVRASDRQRLQRAWAVKTHTGRSILDWRAGTAAAAPAYAFHTIVLLPDREAVYAACDRRFARMVEAGAVAEVDALMAMALDPDLPAMKAVGVPEIMAHLRGVLDRAAMIEAGQRSTRRYAKRQYTWFRHQTAAEQILVAQFSESLLREFFPKIRQFLLTLDR
jgi:tRNA dimethylallyltransferase